MARVTRQRPTAVKDCLEEFQEDFLGEEPAGWSTADMARTVGRMIRGADTVARNLAQAADSLKNVFQEAPATPKEISQLATALRNVSNAIQCYSEVYSWCIAEGQTGKENPNVLDELLPHLDSDELREFNGWLARLERTKAG